MNAGLLGEHLASPRTATKTNQSTALDSKPAKSGDSSTKDEFASYVNSDASAAPSDRPAEDAGVAPVPVPDTPQQSQIQALDLEAQQAASDAALDAETETVTPAKFSAAEAATAEAPQSGDVALRATNNEAQPSPPKPDEASEIVAQDPRVRSQAETRDATREPRAQTIKLGEATGPTSREVTTGSSNADQPSLESYAIDGARSETRADAAETLRNTANLSASDANSAENTFRQTVSAETTAVDRLTSGTVAREVTSIVPDTVTTTTLAAASPPSTVSTPTTGLIPTAPSIPLATPSELTGVILNAINNGIDPQEQLVVQMDPPELGRVMIDFKFDAQGLQQIVVTTENPEALKRLREMHFELTQALRDHGLAEQNMTFREQAGGQSQQDWAGSDSASDSSRQEAPLFAAEDRRTSPSAVPVVNTAQSRDRLDLLL